MPIWLIWLGLRARYTLGFMLGWAGRNPAVAALVALACMSGLLLHEYEVRGRTIARLTADKARIVGAQHDAQVLAQQAHDHQEAVYQAKAQDADHEFNQSLADARHSADLYIAGHRAVLVRPSTAGGAPGGAVASAASGSAGGVVGPSTAPDMVAVTAGDIQICTVNTERLLAAHDWAAGLNVAP